MVLRGLRLRGWVLSARVKESVAVWLSVRAGLHCPLGLCGLQPLSEEEVVLPLNNAPWDWQM